MKQITLFLILICISSANAITINEIHYNPIGSEYESEYVELYSKTEVDISGFWLNTTSSERDVTFPLGFTFSGTILIADEGYNNGADYEEDMTLNNLGGYVKLFSEGGIVAELSYPGDCTEGESYYETGCGVATPDGSYKNSHIINVELTVESSAPSIIEFSIIDDASEITGVQVLPGEKEINLIVQGGVTSSQILLDGVEIISLNIPLTMIPGLHNLMVIICNNQECTTENFDFTVMEVLGFIMDTNNLIVENFLVIGDTDIDTINHPTIKNIGNVPCNIKFSSTGIGPITSDYISVSLGDEFFTLPFQFELFVNTVMAVSFQFESPPGINEGKHFGEIVVSASK